MSLVIKTKVVQNVNRMSKSQSDRQDNMQCARQTEWQRDRMTVWQNSRAAKEPALVKIKFTLNSIFYIEMAANFQFQIKIFHLS